VQLLYVSTILHFHRRVGRLKDLRRHHERSKADTREEARRAVPGGGGVLAPAIAGSVYC
jgi:hypothetical protein